jgi:hypothetical protein
MSSATTHPSANRNNDSEGARAISCAGGKEHREDTNRVVMIICGALRLTCYTAVHQPASQLPLFFLPPSLAERRPPALRPLGRLVQVWVCRPRTPTNTTEKAEGGAVVYVTGEDALVAADNHRKRQNTGRNKARDRGGGEGWAGDVLSSPIRVLCVKCAFFFALLVSWSKHARRGYSERNSPATSAQHKSPP